MFVFDIVLMMCMTDIHIFSPTSRHQWSSRYIAEQIFPNHTRVDFQQFQGFSGNSYKSGSAQVLASQAQVEDDSMDVDEDASKLETITVTDARNDLHRQVVRYFTGLLVELVGLIGDEEITKTLQNTGRGLSKSIYAPNWQKKGIHYSKWSAPDLLEYLGGKRKQPATSPRLDAFLSYPYTYQGARRGQDWSPADWLNALRALKKLGDPDQWNFSYIQESLGYLEPHLERVFSQEMPI